MQTTKDSLSILQSSLTQTDLSAILQLLTLAIEGTTSHQQTKVYQMLNLIEQKSQTYLYFTYIICNNNYNENIRYMAAITMNSALKRNAKQIHFQDNQKTIMKSALLQNYVNNSIKLISVQNILISQFASCFQQMDWQLIHFLVQKINVVPQILTLLIIIFEDLKHNKQNFCYLQGNQEMIIIKQLIQKVHSFMKNLVPLINFGQNLSSDYNNCVQNLIKCIKLIKTITFHIPHKLVAFFQVYCRQVLLVLIQKFDVFITKIKKQSQNGYDVKNFVNKWSNSNRQNMLIQEVFESINEIIQTKPDFIVNNQNLKDFILSFSSKIFIQVNQMNNILKTWTNIILELLFIQQAQQHIGNSLQILLPNILAGMQFTSMDQIHIKEEMQLEHNPYNNQQNQDEDENFQQSYGKNHGSTLRKISITCVQKLSQIYSQNLWSVSKQLIQLLLFKENYKEYESAILYLGVIAQYCSQQLQESIHNFVKYLFQKLNDKHQIVIATCIWTLQKLSPMFSNDINIKFQCYQRIFKIVEFSNSQNKNSKNHTKILMMKQSAISFLDQLISMELQIDYSIYEQIIKSLLVGLRQFTGRALFNVFKAISTIFQKPQQQYQAKIFSILIQEICHKWSLSIRNDSVMCPLIQCLVIICQNRKQNFINYAYEFLLQLSNFLTLVQRKALLLRSIDLVSAVLQLVKQFPSHQNSVKIIAYVSSTAFLNSLHSLITNQQKQIRHFSYGLLSDIIKIQPLSLDYAQEFIKIIANTIDIHSDASANNALMCITDLITIHRECGIKYVQQVMKMVVSFIFKAKNNQLPRIYLLNFSRMFGRLSVLSPELAESYLLNGQQILSNISNGLRGLQESCLTLTSYSSILKVLNNLEEKNLSILIKTKQAQKYVQSYMEYSYNFKQVNEINQFIKFLLKLKLIISQNNDIVWHQYLSNNTSLLPAIINKIITMTKSHS